MNLLTLPPRLVLRALDDLHAIALAARALPDIERSLIERADAIVAMGDRMDARVGEVLTHIPVLEASAQDTAAAGREVAAAMPTIERVLVTAEAVALSAEALAAVAEPLHGAAERLGRIVDRLPGARRA